MSDDQYYGGEVLDFAADCIEPKEADAIEANLESAVKILMEKGYDLPRILDIAKDHYVEIEVKKNGNA